MSPRQLGIGVAAMLAVALVMGLYALRMRGRAQTATPPANEAQAVAPPTAGPTEAVTLYVAHDDSGTLEEVSAHIPLPPSGQQRAEGVLRGLLRVYLNSSSPHAIPAAAEIRSVYLVDPGLAVIDINSEFANNHRSGVLVEELTVVSLVRTLTANVSGISRVKILVDGHERDTLAGHADLSCFYDVAAMNQLAEQISAGQ